MSNINNQITTATQSRNGMLAWAASAAAGTCAGARARKHVTAPVFAGAQGTSVWSPPIS